MADDVRVNGYGHGYGRLYGNITIIVVIIVIIVILDAIIIERVIGNYAVIEVTIRYCGICFGLKNRFHNSSIACCFTI